MFRRARRCAEAGRVEVQAPAKHCGAPSGGLTVANRLPGDDSLPFKQGVRCAPNVGHALAHEARLANGCAGMPPCPVVCVPYAEQGLNSGAGIVLGVNAQARAEHHHETGFLRMFHHMGASGDGQGRSIVLCAARLKNHRRAPIGRRLVGQVEAVQVALQIPGVGSIYRAVQVQVNQRRLAQAVRRSLAGNAGPKGGQLTEFTGCPAIKATVYEQNKQGCALRRAAVPVAEQGHPLLFAVCVLRVAHTHPHLADGVA